jgi:hypothetical protein
LQIKIFVHKDVPKSYIRWLMLKPLLLFSFFLSTIFAEKQYEKWIVVTTIQYPTEQLKQLAQIPDWHLVVVGDKKTPKDWHLENCDYLSPERQLELGYELTNLLPWNHYSRKNIGYLFAIENGAKIIYETDDDNLPIGALNPSSQNCELHGLKHADNCVNVYGYFGQPHVWPRGYPLDKIKEGNHFLVTTPEPCQIGIEQGVVNKSPDVDAIFRLTQEEEIVFEERFPCFLPENLFCPFNSQNTFFHQAAFFTMYIPSTPTMRVSDIWRGYIAQKLIWEKGLKLIFSGPNAIQERNAHSLMNDFFLEQALYSQGSALVDYLKDWSVYDHPLGSMYALYKDLVREGFVEEKELHLLKAWISDLKKIQMASSRP